MSALHLVKLALLLVKLALLLNLARATTLPNIVIILADDLGWNDVSFHGSDQFLTPNIDALAYTGVILRDYYTQPICTPSRAALLTGVHPIHNGMEHDVIYAPQPWGLPLGERLLPEYLRDRGYATRAVGKWHLGFFRAAYTPTHRGFDSHYGMWLGHQDHYTHMAYEPRPGYDFRRDLNVSWEARGKYNTDLFTQEAESLIESHDVDKPLFLYFAHTAPHAPLQAPQHVIDNFSYIKSKPRRVFAAMVTKVDESVGRVVEALKKKNMLNNTILLFLSDNGGATHGYDGNVASNYPLRGCKNTMWEGGVRGVGLVWSPLLKNTPRVHQGLVSVHDWLPTLLSATNHSSALDDAVSLDGVNQWPALNNEESAPYQGVLHNIDPVSKVGALRAGKWKVVYGRKFNGKFDGFYGRLKEKVPYDLSTVKNSAVGQAVKTMFPEDEGILELRTRATVSCSPESRSKALNGKLRRWRSVNMNMLGAQDPFACKPHLSACLFDLEEDPCETQNLALLYPREADRLMSMIQGYKPAPPNNRPPDPRSYPVHWNNTWTTWMDFL